LHIQSERATSLAPNSVHAKKLSKRFEKALRAHYVRVESRVIESKNPKAYYSLCKSRLKSGNSAPPSPLLPLADSHSSPKFDLPSISVSQILIAIRSLSPKCNLSPDGIPNIVYSRCKFSIISPLLIIFNKSLLNNSTPKIWKKAIVKPIPKTSSNAINNFRPISLTCSVTKIFEKILIFEITEYLDANNLFDPYQAGFRLHRSTCTQFINGKPLSVSPSMKDLGILMQPSLKFNDHITKIISKARAQ
ncbi:hypothetical protein PMAYCL1PPCAC_03274, partial [Pristionchus mayeri]